MTVFLHEVRDYHNPLAGNYWDKMDSQHVVEANFEI
jgi:hypothetical protein